MSACLARVLRGAWVSTKNERFLKNHRLANRQTLVFGHKFGELDAHEPCARHSLLEEKGRADEELEDGHRHGPAFRYRGHPSKHTTNREHFFLTNPPTLLILTSCTSPNVPPTTGGRSRKGEEPGETLTPQAKRVDI